MDWKDVGRLIAPLAPAAGSILGGLVPFPGASLIGQKFGEVIAAEFGVPATPQAVSEAIATAGEETARAKINAAVETARVQVDGFVEIEKTYQRTIEVGLTETNETMRAELGHEHWFFSGWRPAAGWLFDIFAAVFGVELSYAIADAAFFGNEKPLAAITAAWPVFAVFLGALAAMVGVYVIGRSQERTAASVLPAPAPAVVKPAPVLKR